MWLLLPQLLCPVWPLWILNVRTCAGIALNHKSSCNLNITNSDCGELTVMKFGSSCRNSYKVLTNIDLLMRFGEVFAAYSGTLSRDCEIGPVSRLGAEGPRNPRAILGRSKILFCSPKCADWLWIPHHPPIEMAPCTLSIG